MDKPIIYRNVVPLSLFHDMQDDLEMWSFSNKSEPKDPMSTTFWGRDFTNDLVMYNVSTYISILLKRDIPYHLSLRRIFYNAATANQPGSKFHVDCDYNDLLTFVLYTSPYWDLQWGGETVVAQPNGEYFYSPYIPNNAVLLPSHWQHYGQSPNAHAKGLRTSVAFMYQICYERPINK